MTESGYRIAVVGATGAVGAALLQVLEEREFPVGRLHLLGRDGNEDGEDEEASEAQTAVFANRGHLVRALSSFDFEGVDLAFFCVPADVAATEVPRAVAAGCRVVDCSAAFRLQPDVPLVVAGANAEIGAARLVASPSAAAVQAASILGPIAAAYGVARVGVHTQLAVSDRGKAAVADLAGQTARLLNVQALKESCFPAQIAFNVIAAFDAAGADGDSACEQSFARELRKILGDEDLAIAPAFSYVPVFYGHSQVLSFETRQESSLAALRKLLKSAPGVEFLDSDAESLSPAGDNFGGDVVVVGRMRHDSASGLFTVWTVADNVRKGAAVNSTEIASALLKPHP